LADLEPHLLYYWHKLDPESQYTLAALPLLEPGVALPVLERLAQAGLIYEGRYLGSALETFVRQQKVEGLRQGGPFLLDTRQGLAAAGSRPIHLTPTEFAALKLFLDQPGQLLTPEALEAALWPDDLAPDPERARGVIKKLRTALGEAGEALVNRRGQGWLLSLEKGDYG
jgi:DNA-binding response OmpR family regulator